VGGHAPPAGVLGSEAAGGSRSSRPQPTRPTMSLGSRCRMSSSATLPLPAARRQLVPLRSVRGHVAAHPVPGKVADSCSLPKFDG
jgi:hypothetical protein